MKLLRIGPAGQERPAVLDARGRVRDLSGKVPDFAGSGVTLQALDAIRGLDIDALPEIEAGDRVGACLAAVPNFYCIGLNYAKHAAESGMDLPKEPIVFSKASSALSGPNDPLTLPRGSEKTDWEVELGVVIGRRAHYVSEAEALSCVAGYCTVNDLSERSYQFDRGGQWIKGKSAPGFGPAGPYLVTADEVPDPQNLHLQLSLNGEVVQSESTSDMVFSVAQIIAHLTQFMVLLPGDLIATGTPSGVGMGMTPQRYLRPGDTVVAEVFGLGSQTTRVLER